MYLDILIGEYLYELKIISVEFHILFLCWYILLAGYPCDFSIVSIDFLI